MKPIRLTLLLAALGLGVSSASATLFDFSYTFSDTQTVITGTLEGTQNGNFIDDVSDLSVFFNGVAMAQLDPTNPVPISFASYDQASGTFLPDPVISTAPSQNNFFFSNGDYASGAFSAYFYLTNASDFVDNPNGPQAGALAFDGDATGDSDATETATGSFWSITPVLTSSVPDGGATAALLGLATVSLLALRRRQATT